MEPATIAALTALITSGVEVGTGALESRRQSKLEKKRTALQDVLKSLNPQTAGQQPVRQGQGWGQLGDTMADPLVQKVISDMIGKVMNGGQPSQKRANLPDASQALTGGGRFGAPGSGVSSAAQRPSAASRAVAAPPTANPMRSQWTQERTGFGPLAPTTGKDGPWRSWNKAPDYSGATALTWPDGRPVTLQQANDPSIPMAIRHTWIRKNPLGR